MSWKLIITPQALKQLSKLDKPTAKIISSWLRKNIEDSENPRRAGRALTSDLAGSWRYRIGDYRILCDMRGSELVVLAFQVAYRSNVYKGRG